MLALIHDRPRPASPSPRILDAFAFFEKRVKQLGPDVSALCAGLYGLSDFSGKTLALRRGRGEKDVEIFVAVLAHSCLIYAEAVPNPSSGLRRDARRRTPLGSRGPLADELRDGHAGGLGALADAPPFGVRGHHGALVPSGVRCVFHSLLQGYVVPLLYPENRILNQ